MKSIFRSKIRLALLLITSIVLSYPGSLLSDDADEAASRIPPVLYSLSIPEQMDDDTTHALTWSVVGYHSGYKTAIAFFDCTDVTADTCGDSYGDASRFDSSGKLDFDSTTDGDWSYGTADSTGFNYSYNFEPVDASFDGTTNIVVRFYYISLAADASGDGTLSLLIPGNLSTTYYDNNGRRLQKQIIE